MLPPNAFFQTAWVVNDLQAAMNHWVKTANVGPFFVNAHVRTSNVTYRGQPTGFDHSLALAQAGPVQIELIEQHSDVPSVYRDSYPKGKEGFHHLGCFVDDVAAEVARYQAQGVELAYNGMFGDMRFAYMDTRAQLGHMIEIIEHKPFIDKLFKHVADAAMGWDGRDPIRKFPAL